MPNVCSRCGSRVEHCEIMHEIKGQTWNQGMGWKTLPKKFYCVYLTDIGDYEHFCSKACIPKPDIIRKATWKWKEVKGD